MKIFYIVLILIVVNLLNVWLNFYFIIDTRGIITLQNYIQSAFDSFFWIIFIGPICEELSIRGIISTTFTWLKWLCIIGAYLILTILVPIYFSYDITSIENIIIRGLYIISIILPLILILLYALYPKKFQSPKLHTWLYLTTTFSFVFSHTDIYPYIFSNQQYGLQILLVRMVYLITIGSIFYYIARFISLKSAIIAHMLNNLVALIAMLIIYLQYIS